MVTTGRLQNVLKLAQSNGFAVVGFMLADHTESTPPTAIQPVKHKFIRKLTPETRALVAQAYKDGHRTVDIAKRFNIDSSHVSRIAIKSGMRRTAIRNKPTMGPAAVTPTVTGL